MFRFNKSLEICKYLIYQTRYVQLNPKTIQTDDYYRKDSHKKILQDYLGLNAQQIYRLLRSNKFLYEVKNVRLMDTLEMLNKIGIKKDDIYKNPLTLSFMESTIEHNVSYLREIGFKNINAHILLRFRVIVKKPISLLKLHGLIPENVDVAKRLLSYIEPPMVCDSINLNDFNDEMSVIDIHIHLLKKFITWRLQCTENETEKLFSTYDRFKYKSLRILSEMIDFLTDELNFTSQKILNNGYIFEIHPKNIKRLIKHFPKLGGENIKTVFFRHPKIMSVPIENFYEILKYLKDFNISDEAIQKCTEIFTLSPISVRNRLNELKNIPEFEVLSKNVRILNLVYCQNKAKLRLELLKNLNVKCASLHLLCSTESIFEKYMQDGNDRTKGIDMVNYLTKELYVPFEEIRESLMKNQHWYHIPTTSVKISLQYLLEWGFPREEIARSPLILLYSKELLRSTIKEMEEKLKESYIILDSRQKLNLLLYEIEQKYHFSGNGVWSIKNKIKKKTTET